MPAMVAAGRGGGLASVAAGGAAAVEDETASGPGLVVSIMVMVDVPYGVFVAVEVAERVVFALRTLEGG